MAPQQAEKDLPRRDSAANRSYSALMNEHSVVRMLLVQTSECSNTERSYVSTSSMYVLFKHWNVQTSDADLRTAIADKKARLYAPQNLDTKMLAFKVFPEMKADFIFSPKIVIIAFFLAR